MQEKLNFRIHYNQNFFEASFNPSTTVGELTRFVTPIFVQCQHLRHVLSERFVCLESLNRNQLVDYALLMPEQRISIFHKDEEFKVYCSDQAYDNDRAASVTDYWFLKCLGQGGSASVYLVRHKASGRLYALKQIDKDYFVEFKRMQQILREKKILSELVPDFPFVATLHCSFQSERHLNFVLEYYPGGELFLHLQRRRLNENQAKLYFCEIVLAFEHLHSQRIIYRDLKPQNIMLDYEGHSRLADFGLCKLNLTSSQFTFSFCGSLEYMAPEVKDSQGYNYSVDFYTLGAFLYEMVVGVPPYYNKQPLYFPERMSRSLIDLIKGLIEKEPARRIDNFQAIRASPWLEVIDWRKVMSKQYQMPIKINIYDSYIHEEFSKVKVDSMNVVREQKFDRLFDLFTYTRATNSRKEGARMHKHKPQTANHRMPSPTDRETIIGKTNLSKSKKKRVSTSKSKEAQLNSRPHSKQRDIAQNRHPNSHRVLPQSVSPKFSRGNLHRQTGTAGENSKGKSKNKSNESKKSSSKPKPRSKEPTPEAEWQKSMRMHPLAGMGMSKGAMYFRK